MKSPQLILIALVIIVIGASIYTQTRTINVGSTCELKETPDPQWLVDYKSKLTKNQTIYLQETEYFDISNPLIKCIAQNIKLSATSDREAAQMALDYVYLNVRYDSKESNEVCFNSKASDVLLRGTGQCDTQTEAVISICRAVGILARPVGGCLSVSPSCASTQSLYSMIGLRAPKIEQIGNISPGQVYGRGITLGRGESTPEESSSVFGRFGGLHAWGEAYFLNSGWTTFESTSGSIISHSCYRYDVELYPSGSTEKEDLCVSKSYEFAMFCRSR